MLGGKRRNREADFESAALSHSASATRMTKASVRSGLRPSMSACFIDAAQIEVARGVETQTHKRRLITASFDAVILLKYHGQCENRNLQVAGDKMPSLSALSHAAWWVG